MPGSDLNLPIPTASEVSFAAFVEKTAECFRLIEADLEPKIDSGSLEITTPLDLGGAPLLNAGGVRLVGGASDEVGTVYVDENGDLYIVTALGDVKLTDNGSINIASLGTIGGDYGGVSPATVTYNSLGGSYSFKADASTWADVLMKSLVLHGTGSNTVTVGVDAAYSGTRTLDFHTIPASGVGAFVYDAATSTLKDASVTRETLTHLFTAINCSSSINASSVTTLAVRERPLSPATSNRRFESPPVADSPYLDGNGDIRMEYPVTGAELYYWLDVRVGEAIGAWKVYAQKVTGNLTTIHAQLFELDLATVARTGLGVEQTNSSSAPGYISFTHNAGHVALAGKRYYVRVKQSGTVAAQDGFYGGTYEATGKL